MSTQGLITSFTLATSEKLVQKRRFHLNQIVRDSIQRNEGIFYRTSKKIGLDEWRTNPCGKAIRAYLLQNLYKLIFDFDLKLVISEIFADEGSTPPEVINQLLNEGRLLLIQGRRFVAVDPEDNWYESERKSVLAILLQGLKEPTTISELNILVTRYGWFKKSTSDIKDILENSICQEEGLFTKLEKRYMALHPPEQICSAIDMVLSEVEKVRLMTTSDLAALTKRKLGRYNHIVHKSRFRHSTMFQWLKQRGLIELYRTKWVKKRIAYYGVQRNDDWEQFIDAVLVSSLIPQHCIEYSTALAIHSGTAPHPDIPFVVSVPKKYRKRVPSLIHDRPVFISSRKEGMRVTRKETIVFYDKRITIVEKHQSILQCLLKPGLCGGHKEVIRLAKRIEGIRVREIVDYIIKKIDEELAQRTDIFLRSMNDKDSLWQFDEKQLDRLQ